MNNWNLCVRQSDRERQLNTMELVQKRCGDNIDNEKDGDEKDGGDNIDNEKDGDEKDGGDNIDNDGNEEENRDVGNNIEKDVDEKDGDEKDGDEKGGGITSTTKKMGMRKMWG